MGACRAMGVLGKACVLALAAVAPGQDPLGGSHDLLVGSAGVNVDHTSAFDGVLHVWARSSDGDPRLSVERTVGGERLEDEDSGGGTTAYLRREVRPGEELRIGVTVGGAEAANVHLVWSVAPEDGTTRSAAERAEGELTEIEGLFDPAERRRRVVALLDELEGVPGEARSERILAARWRAGWLAVEGGDPRSAERAFSSVHAQRAQCLPPSHPNLLRIEQSLGVVRLQAGDVAGARAMFERVHDARRAYLPEDHPDLLAALQGLALVRRLGGDHAGSAQAFGSIWTVLQARLGAEHPDVLAVRTNLAGALYALGDYGSALEHQSAVRAVQQRILPADDRSLLVTESNLALTLKALRDLAGALELERRVHAEFTRQLPEDHPDRLSAASHLATTWLQLGELVDAHALLEDVHLKQTRVLPPEHPGLLATKQALAVARKHLGDLDGALELEEFVLEVRAEALGPEHAATLEARQNLASTLQSRGRYAESRREFEALHAQRERTLDAKHPDRLAAAHNLGMARALSGDLAGARELEEAVYAARRSVLPQGHPDLLLTQQNLAATRKECGDLAGALELERSVHAAWSEVLPAGHPDRLRCEVNLALTLEALGDLEGARALWDDLLAGVRARTAELALLAPRSARAGALRELRRLATLLHLGECFDEQLGGSTAPALFDTLEGLRDLSVGGRAAASAVRRVPELEQDRLRLASVRTELSERGLARPDTAQAQAAWRAALVALGEERDRLERKLRVGLAAAGVAMEPPRGREAAAALPPDGAWISFLRYPRYASAPDAGEPIDSLLAFVLMPSGVVRRVELGPAAAIEELASHFRSQLGKPVERGLAPLPVEGDPIDWGMRLRAALLDPCLAPLAAARPALLHLVLDDFLHLVPVDALPLPDGERLGDACRVRIEPSLRRLAQPQPARAPTGTLVALGGIDFSAAEDEERSQPRRGGVPPSLQRSASPRAFAPLPQSRFEVEAVAGLYEELRGGEPVLRTRSRATKAALVELAPRARYLHLATHGWFVPESEARSSLDAGVDPEARVPDERVQRTLQGLLPETLCGLALAGADLGVDERGRAYGILTAEELATLDLSGCELAVLSACETNVGLRRAGQGIQSLQAAVHAAGARTAITSLWRVDDAATRRFFELFYTYHWGEGLGKAEALRRARRALRDEGHGAQDWAAWVLSGDPD